MRVTFIALSIAVLMAPLCRAAAPRHILVEAESFENEGGWVVDQQSYDQMGSAYLMAHGMGTPVEDARTTVTPPAAGKYRVWVRTRNWAPAAAGAAAPGRFQLLVNGKPLPVTFGTEGAVWHWQDGGVVTLPRRPVSLALHDLTGFNGRCDAVLLTGELMGRPPEPSALRRPSVPREGGAFDLVVAGGGIAGITTAVSAARLGLKVALIQDRPMLGGNNSSEVRVHLGGNINLPPYPALGAVVSELDSGLRGNAQPAANYDDERKMAVVKAEKNLSLFLSTRATGVEKKGNRITAVLARHVKTGQTVRFTAPLFADCTGDGVLGALAGADFRYGRESRAETGEPLAPETADRLVMGTSVMWYAEDAGKPVSFPDCPWAIAFNEQTVQNATRGDWNWETGHNRDQVEDIEAIRDHGLRAVFGNWAFQKNHSQDRAKYANLRLGWVAYIGGKRESRRLLGDVILNQHDIEQQRAYPDAAVTATWSIDLHYPDPKNTQSFPGEEFRSIAKFGKKAPYAVPYRCFYSRNIENLFMAGRNISVTHVALGTIRVQRTTGMIGEVVGMAASLCRKHNVLPRAVYTNHLEELKALMNTGVGRK